MTPHNNPSDAPPEPASGTGLRRPFQHLFRWLNLANLPHLPA